MGPRGEVLLDVRAEVLLDEHYANGGSRVGPRPIRAQTEVRRAARKSAGRIVFQRMPETTSNDSLREEFNRWAEAGRGEGMEQEHLPITLPVLEKMRLRSTDNVLDVGCGADRKSTRLNSSHSQISYAVFCLKKK